MNLSDLFNQPREVVTPILKRGDRIAKGGEEYIIAIAPHEKGLFLLNTRTGCTKNGNCVDCDKDQNITENEIAEMIGRMHPGISGWVKTKDCG